MNKNFLLIFILLFSITLISAVPPVTTTQQFTEGYNIQIPQDNILKVNEPYIFEFHVFNISNGQPKTSGISCDLHLYDNLGNNLFTGTDNSADTYGDYTFNLTKGNFSKVDNYYYFVRCNSSSLGGFSESILNITPSGNGGSPANIAFFILVIALVYGVTLVGYLKQDYYITILGSMAMLFLGVYLFNNGIIIFRDDLTRYLSYMTMGLGAIISVVMSILIIQDNL
jgi:hypothetical protein